MASIGERISLNSNICNRKSFKRSSLWFIYYLYIWISIRHENDRLTRDCLSSHAWRLEYIRHFSFLETWSNTHFLKLVLTILLNFWNYRFYQYHYIYDEIVWCYQGFDHIKIIIFLHEKHALIHFRGVCYSILILVLPKRKKKNPPTQSSVKRNDSKANWSDQFCPKNKQ